MNRTLTVTQLSYYLKGVFEDEELLHDITLIGEVSDISYSDKHTFLTLADGAYSVRCVHFSARDNIEKGVRVALRGTVDFYDKRNSVSFNYKEYFLHGAGDKSAELSALKEKLRGLGYFENRPQLPEYIVDVTVVTSPDGAAIKDFMRVVYDKSPFVNIRVFPVRVQGEGAAAQIAQAVARLQSRKTDAIVICRGGGSDEDLDCFNDERLAVAVAQSEIPVISAVGHEINYSLCDYCAGTRAGTPSIAGEIVNSHARKILYDLYGALSAVRESVNARCRREALRLNRLGIATTSALSMRIGNGYGEVGGVSRRIRYALSKKIEARANKAAVCARRIRSAVTTRTADRCAHCEKLASILSALDPHRIFKVGYAAVLRDRDRIVKACELVPSDEIRLIFSDGTATAVIKEVK